MRPRAAAAAILLSAALLACGPSEETIAAATSVGGGTGSSSASTGTGEGAAPPTPDGDVSVAWGVRWGAKATDERMGQVLVDDDDSVLVVGSVGTFDAVEPALAAVDELDVLLARFDGAGQVLAARTIGGAPSRRRRSTERGR